MLNTLNSRPSWPVSSRPTMLGSTPAPCSSRLRPPAGDGRGNGAHPNSPRQFFIASTTKLYVTAIIMQLCDQRQVNLDAEAVKYLDPSIMAGIHVLRGVDSSHRITVRELLSHTSGIADYFEQRRADGRSQFRTRSRRTSPGHLRTSSASQRKS